MVGWQEDKKGEREGRKLELQAVTPSVPGSDIIPFSKNFSESDLDLGLLLIFQTSLIAS